MLSYDAPLFVLFCVCVFVCLYACGVCDVLCDGAQCVCIRVLRFPMLLSVLVCVEVQVWFVCDMLCEVAWCGVSVAVGI